ncbi:phospholipase effector Tle1 domain-containing protein [Aphanothece sacrum]|uniref:T6SS Phospholipase effector Tle1-like catalytic domain-containing protein n=1 Tax=Aphanothece sacrum FPU1 TaxID=1920663 RepID=A0A401IGE4_APHSA|nr:DUF2235 domain-containing protein [Aphanothece sacrum]GBF80260.1 hypothetical protein AsFPU1_1661 [Aphanothece sacrum FPU1]GBF83665.1 hypothetical protein AsFPU3_0708 [Aphanothece sacrum FPU3]
MTEQNQEYVLKFDGVDDYIELSQIFSGFETGITLEFLAKGKSGLTQQTTIVEGYNSQNERVINVHLPYYKKGTGGCVSWEVVHENGVDRIEKKLNIREYKIWTYWTFVKDLSLAQMSIYQNGRLWHQADEMYQPLTNIQKLVIGSSVNGSEFWKGHLSEFRIWNRACTEAEIKEDRNERLVGNEPGLSVYLPLNGDTSDHSGNGNHAIVYGASWMERKIPLKVEQLPDEETDKVTPSIQQSSEVETEEITQLIELSSEVETEEITQLIELSSEIETEEITRSIELSSEIETEEITRSIELSSEVEMEETSPSVDSVKTLSNSQNQQITQAINSMNQKKRLVVCCDGTWNELTNSYPSNVLKFARLVKYMAEDKTPQLVFYLPGLGTEDGNAIEQLGGGAFGWGIDETIKQAYGLLCMNYDETAQDEIYLVGFSRGAYIARCLAAMIYNCGLLRRSKIKEIPKAYELYRNAKIKPDDPELQKFRQSNAQKIDNQESYLNYRVPIKMLGCWDTVGALGMPDIIPWLPIEKFLNQKYEFLDASLSPIIDNAFHAVAIDEKRKSFPSTPMIPSQENPQQKVEEVWFAGTHGCLGGGTKEYRGLSDYPLQWMLNKAQTLGLEFYSTENDEEDFQIQPNPMTKFDNSVTGIYALGGEEWRKIDSSQVFIHHSVVERLKSSAEYRPENLKPLLKGLLPSDSDKEEEKAEKS